MGHEDWPDPLKHRILDEAYLDLVRAQPCCLQFCGQQADPDHLIARGWRENKRNDYTAIPLCRKHHSERHQLGNSRFEQRYEISLWYELVRCLIGYLEKLPLRDDRDEAGG